MSVDEFLSWQAVAKVAILLMVAGMAIALGGS